MVASHMAAFPSPSLSNCTHTRAGRLQVICSEDDLDPELREVGAVGTWDGVNYKVTRIFSGGSSMITVTAQRVEAEP